MQNEKILVKIQITPAAKRAVEEVCKRHDMTQIGVISRLISWFVAQDEITQALALNLIPSQGKREVLMSILGHHLSTVKKVDTVDQAKAISEVLDQINLTTGGGKGAEVEADALRELRQPSKGRKAAS